VIGRELALRRGILLVVLAAAATGVLAGLARLGLVTAWGAARAFEHGALLVLGVFGTVIGLERAVALGQRWSYLAPALGAAGAVGLLGGLPQAPWIAAASSVALVLINAAIVRRQAAAFTVIMLAAAAALATGSIVWATGAPVFQVVPTWLAFLVLTIVAERLELSRLAPTPRWATRAVVVLAALVVVAAVAALLGAGARALGVVLALLGGWQLRFDLARRTVRRPGLPRYVAVAVLVGSAWLLVGGVLMALLGLPAAGPHYDAVLHAVLIGFVLSMVFAHAPIILPAVARIDLPFHRGLYLGPALLHASLVVRLVGALAGSAAARQLGAAGNGLALAGFLAAAVVASRTRRRPAPGCSSRPNMEQAAARRAAKVA
jgi:hypothetical protein